MSFLARDRAQASVWDLSVWDLSVWDFNVCDLRVWDLSVWDLRVCDIGVLLARLGLAERVGCEQRACERLRDGAQRVRTQHAQGQSLRARSERRTASFAGDRVGKHRNPFILARQPQILPVMTKPPDVSQRTYATGLPKSPCRA
jgi:hypothetical protein